ncbi:MAG: hypothetical protein IPK78_09860 [Rhodospirillales bacterium]|nr:hypothetical protein [Rhodospirillales bacterium]
MATIYRFRIDVYTPETIPLATLARYMERLAQLLGSEHGVHFAGLEDGSTQLLGRVDHEEVPKVRDRLDQVRRGEAPPAAMKVFDEIDHLLAADNAVGALYEEVQGHTAQIIAFPGRTRPKPARYGPFNQEGSLDGFLVSIGGVDKTISLQLQNGDIKYTGCETTREIARQLGKHCSSPVRIHGTGRWLREEDGTWTLKRFRVQSFEVLRREDLKEVVERLRAVEGSAWRELDDPTAALEKIRRGESELH